MQKTKGKATDLDAFIGPKIREARGIIGISQTEAGKILDVSFQQIQKIETGKNRISAANLARLAYAFDYPVVWFFPESYQKGDGGICRMISKYQARSNEILHATVKIEKTIKEIQRKISE